ncbi:MAG: thiamine-phosphate kinase [Gemmatimonadota bacterium]|nr:thiamine-phosphate kinase [Gemmatimonadota bacterium]
MSGTRLGTGAEFDLIRSLLARYGAAAVGVGDDAGAVHAPPGEILLASTDVAVDDVHFRAAWLPPDAIGYRATMAALSDLAAMAAVPRGILVALTLPRRWRGSAGAIADGIARAAREASAPIVGGDVSGGSALAIAVTVLGSTARPLTRSGARPGDAIWVTGRFGGPALALDALAGGARPSPADERRFAAPVARIPEGRWLAAHGACAGVDVSDGLAADLAHVAAASGVRITLDLDLVPAVDGATPEVAAASGEEYELAVAGPADLDAAAFAREFGVPLTRVGTVDAVPPSPGEAGSEVRVIRHGVTVPAPPGFDHLAP